MTRTSTVSDEVLEKAKKRLVTLSETWTACVTRGEAWSLEGKVIGGRGYTACHAWITHMFKRHCSGVKGQKMTGYEKWEAMPRENKDLCDANKGNYHPEARNFLTLSCHSKVRSKKICSPEAHEAIILWMASDDCVLSKYILNRDDKDSLLNGGVVILSGPDGASSQETMWMCKVLRYGVEASQALDTWKQLYDAGVSPGFALLVSSYIRTVTEDSFCFTGMESHSSVFNAFKYSEENLRSVVELNNPNPKAEKTSDLFAPAGGEAGSFVISTKIQGFCKPVQKSDGWGGTVDAKAVTKPEFIQNVLQWQEEIIQNTTEKEKKIAKKPAKRGSLARRKAA